LNYNESHTDLFNAYLRRTLSEAELLAFEKRLKDDTDFAEAFKFHELVLEGVREHGRMELKQFLAHSAKPATGKGKIIRFSSMQWAAAAVIVVIIGIYAVTQFYIQPKTEHELAIEKATEVLTVPAPTDSLIAKNEVVTYDSLYANPEAVQAPPNDVSEILEPMDIETADDGGGAPSVDDFSGKELAESDNFKIEDKKYEVLTERKLKDTSVYLYSLAYEAPSYSNNNYGSKKLGVAKLPSNTNTKPAAAEKVDTEVSKKKDRGPSALKITIEFWQSPVNFKGYKYWGNTVQLYGADQATARLFIINNEFYLRDNGKVYLLLISPDATPYKPILDDNLTQFILSQK
jgi:hypothetical protein